MKHVKYILLFILITQIALAQKTAVNKYTSIDQKALQIPDSLTKTTELISSYIKSNFRTDEDKSRAIFIWIASHIQYDLENMFSINFYEKKDEKITKTLKTRKGICENFTSLFTDICNKSGIESYVIEGYTKQNGFSNYLPHAWSVARIENSWFLFDPTWGSGYVNGGRFFKKINSNYYKVNPATMIKSHIPFDYLWQFLNYPVTNQEFNEGKTHENKAKQFFNFNDTLQVYKKQNHFDQLISTAYRIEKNGVKNSLVFDRLQHLKLEIENEKQNERVNLYNSSAADYNEAINSLNEFISYRNKQITPKRTDPEIQEMIDKIDVKLKSAKSKLEQISNPDTNVSNLIQQLSKSINDVEKQLKDQQSWLSKYLSKSKSGRKSMFYKVTWFGMPLN